MPQSKTANVSVTAGSPMVWLTVTLVILKALGYLHWSWWIVFLPLWGPFALFLGIGLVVLLFIAIGAFLGVRRDDRIRANKGWKLR